MSGAAASDISVVPAAAAKTRPAAAAAVWAIFLARDTISMANRLLVVFRWDARNKQRPVWGQAFSPDNGKTWEWNFFNVWNGPRINR